MRFAPALRASGLRAGLPAARISPAEVRRRYSEGGQQVQWCGRELLRKKVMTDE